MYKIVALMLFMLMLLPTVLFAETWQEYIGLEWLQSNYPNANGAGIQVGQVEPNADADYPGYCYIPATNDSSDAEYSNKSFTFHQDPTNNPVISWHAKPGAQRFYGNNTGIAPGVTNISCYEAGHFIDNYILGSSNTSDKVINQSFVFNESTDTGTVDFYERKWDRFVDINGIVVVQGAGNDGSITNTIRAPGGAYNIITVGSMAETDTDFSSVADRSSRGPTWDNRAKPDLVAPGHQSATSWSAPRVSGAAAVLLQSATGSLVNADDPRVIKSILMTSADKLSGWHKGYDTTNDDHSVPLDYAQGAGALQVDDAYRLLIAGEYGPGNVGTNATGWDLNTIPSTGKPTTNQVYYFDLTGNIYTQGFRLTATLNWYREVDALNNTDLENLDLAFYSASDTTLLSMLDWSTSAVDNVEHLYFDYDSPGEYALVVNYDASAGGTTYALSWYAIPEPSIFLLLAGGIMSLLACMKFRAKKA